MSDSTNFTTSEWLPIDTAPKDGDKVLLFSTVSDAEYIDIAYWDGRNWIVVGSGTKADGIGGKSTHWMPLPQPPAQEVTQ